MVKFNKYYIWFYVSKIFKGNERNIIEQQYLLKRGQDFSLFMKQIFRMFIMCQVGFYMLGKYKYVRQISFLFLGILLGSNGREIIISYIKIIKLEIL